MYLFMHIIISSYFQWFVEWIFNGISKFKKENSSPIEYTNVEVYALQDKFYPTAQPKAVIRDFGYGDTTYNYINTDDGTHEVKTAFNFDGSATVTDLVTSSVRGRDWSGFVQDIISKECTDVEVVMGGATFTFKFTGQYSGTKPVFGYDGYQIIYVSDQWQLKKLDNGLVLGFVKSESACPEVSGWTWTDGSTTNAVSQGISNISMMLEYMLANFDYFRCPCLCDWGQDFQWNCDT